MAREKKALFWAVAGRYSPDQGRIVRVTTLRARHWWGSDVREGYATHGTTGDLLVRGDSLEAAEAVRERVGRVARYVRERCATLELVSSRVRRMERDLIAQILAGEDVETALRALSLDEETAQLIVSAVVRAVRAADPGLALDAQAEGALGEVAMLVHAVRRSR